MELKNPGINDRGALSVLWAPGRDRETLVALVQRSHQWTPLLKDSITCCTMAVLTSQCLEPVDTKDGRRCQGQLNDGGLQKGFSVPQTRLIINPKGPLLDGLELRPCKGKYNQRWGVSGVKKESKIFLGAQGCLKVISSMSRKGLVGRMA